VLQPGSLGRLVSEQKLRPPERHLRDDERTARDLHHPMGDLQRSSTFLPVRALRENTGRIASIQFAETEQRISQRLLKLAAEQQNVQQP